MVEVAITKQPASLNMYTKMLLAAERRQEQVMLDKVHGVANGDLVAVEARYQRQKGCYTHYISNKHIIIKQHSSDASNTKSPYLDIIRKLLDEIKPPIP